LAEHDDEVSPSGPVGQTGSDIMRRPTLKFTLRHMMVAIAVLAADLGLIRGAMILTDQHSSLFVLLPAYALVPSLSLLTVALASVVLGLLKHRRTPPFATGYLLMGVLTSFGMTLALAVQAYWIFAVTVREPELDLSPWVAGLSDVMLVGLLGLLQVVPALIGGVLAARYGLTIVRGDQGAHDSGAEPRGSVHPKLPA
jgi:hypothetical protein